MEPVGPIENAARNVGEAIGYFIGSNFWWTFPLIAVVIGVLVYRRRSRR